MKVSRPRCVENLIQLELYSKSPLTFFFFLYISIVCIIWRYTHSMVSLWLNKSSSIIRNLKALPGWIIFPLDVVYSACVKVFVQVNEPITRTKVESKIAAIKPMCISDHDFYNSNLKLRWFSKMMVVSASNCPVFFVFTRCFWTAILMYITHSVGRLPWLRI